MRSLRTPAVMVARSLVLIAVLAACAPKQQNTIPVAILVDGDRGRVGAIAKTSVSGLDLHSLELPAPAPLAPEPSGTAVAHARSLYASGDFDACRDVLAKIDVAHLLAIRERELAARVLTLATACAWGALDKSAAMTTAARIASYGLELTDLAVSPDVERVIGDAVATSGKAPRSALGVTGEVGARLGVDGREAGCALPCTIDLAPGDHVIAVDADGFQPAVQTVRTPDTKNLAMRQQPASAELAARQWRARIGRGQPAADIVGAALIGKLAKDSRVAYIRGDKQLTGALVVDGKLVASARGEPGAGPALVRELAYDGRLLHRPSIWQRPWFWIATTAAVAVAAGAVVAVTYEPDKHTRLVVP